MINRIKDSYDEKMLNEHIRDKTFEVRLGRKNKEDCCIEPNCENGGVICPAHSECISTIDGYICTCDQGYETPDNGDNVCEDIDECSSANSCNENAFCTNNVGSYVCECYPNFFYF